MRRPHPPSTAIAIPAASQRLNALVLQHRLRILVRPDQKKIGLHAALRHLAQRRIRLRNQPHAQRPPHPDLILQRAQRLIQRVDHKVEFAAPHRRLHRAGVAIEQPA